MQARVEVPRDVAHGTLLLRGATALTQRGDEAIADADLLVRDGRIAAIGPRGSVEIPAGAQLRDVSGRFIIPGLIDVHDHVEEVPHHKTDDRQDHHNGHDAQRRTALAGRGRRRLGRSCSRLAHRRCLRNSVVREWSRRVRCRAQVPA
ncbi:amidohydrolase family protein [Pectobacterium brasiliense]|uniref:amidohydrolase family protein n=1 Tax=Pectobacterium brasiliense TaxID=180957 RepID=UPI0025A0A288|nr:hypothetical protein [Pectobacterium brasiliense]WJM81177.1 hypothetical protein QTI90_23870 [Pectobacterium brasiliense]